MAKDLKILSILLVLIQMLYAQNNEPASEAEAFLQESQATYFAEESSYENSYESELSPQQRFEESPKHNVHEYDYKQQVIVGGVVMFCLALSLIANNNYNPKHGK